MTTPADAARAWLLAHEDEVSGGSACDWYAVQSRAGQNIASLARLIEAREREAVREVHQRMRKMLLHPSVRDTPIPQAIWHFLRNLEHETGDLPIGYATGREGEAHSRTTRR